MKFKPGDRVLWVDIPATVVALPNGWEDSGESVAIVTDGDFEVGVVTASSLALRTS